VLDFGTSGELYQSALVMYDRQTSSLWAHFTGQGLVGHYAGAELALIPAQTVSWAQFTEAHPDGLVLSRDTGWSRDYGRNPYVGYDAEDSRPIGGFFNGEVDPTLAAKARVVGIVGTQGETGPDATGADGSVPVAVRLEDVVARSVVAVEERGWDVVVFHRPGLASALDSDAVDGGRDVGQTGVFRPRAPDGTPLRFAPHGDGSDGLFVDDATGTTWNVTGQAVAGPLAEVDARLEAVPHLDTFWFAWATYRPDAVLITL
jgi:hypothetical protein